VRLADREQEWLASLVTAHDAQTSTVAVSHVHGSLDLAHILVHEGDFHFVGPGDAANLPPEDRLRDQSPFVDLATMLRSFHLASEVALATRAATAAHQIDRLTGWARRWTAVVSTSFLHAYRRAAARTGLLPDDDTAVLLLRAYLVEQAFTDIRDRLTGRPVWLDIVLTTPEVV
jgi:maltose alpha-D-glucosyltransferase/alpha-amylase